MANFRISGIVPRAIARTSLRTSFYPSPAVQTRFYAANGTSKGSSYGGGEGDPRGENPQDQPTQKNSDLEHPGPPPVKEGLGTGGGPTKAGSEGHHGADQASSGSGSSNSAPQSSSSKGSSPKIHNPNPLVSGSESEDVRRHNEEFERTHDRSASNDGDDDKVDKKFWTGTNESASGLSLPFADISCRSGWCR